MATGVEADQTPASMIIDKFQGIDVPENLAHFTKYFEDGQSAHLVMTQTALAELGDYDAVERVFQASVQEPGFMPLFTSNELKPHYDDPDDPRNELAQQADYLDKAFGDIMKQMKVLYTKRLWFGDLDRESSVLDPVGQTGVKIVSMRSEDYLGESAFIEGSLQQKIDFILAHELDHNDNAKDDVERYHMELSSDNTGLCAIEGDEVDGNLSREDAARSLIAKRIYEDVVAQVFSVAGGGYSNGLHDYSIGPYIEACAPAHIPDGANTVYADYFDHVTNEIKARAPDWFKDYDITQRPSDIIYKSDEATKYFFSGVGLRRVLSEMGVGYSDISPHTRAFSDLPMLHESARADYINVLRKEFGPEFDHAVDAVVYGNGVFYTLQNDIYALENVDPVMKALSDEIVAIKSVEDARTRSAMKVDFVKSFIQDHPDMVRPAVLDTLSASVILDRYKNEPEQFRQHVDEIIRDTYPSITDEALKSAVEIYMEENPLNQGSPAASVSTFKP